MKSKEEVKKQFKRHYEISKSGLKNQYRHIQECQSFYAGDYMNYRDMYAFGRGSSRKVKEVQFNCVKPYVNSIVGFLAQIRRKPDYQAREPNNEYQKALSDYQNGLSDYIRENAHSDQVETQQDKDLIIGGVGATDVAITLRDGNPTRTPNGEILVERVNPKYVGWDPDAVATNLLDSRWVYRAEDYDVEEAEELFNQDEDAFEAVDPDDDITNYEFNPFGGIQDKIGYEWSDPHRKMVRVYFYQWFEVENFYRVENPLLAQTDPLLQITLAEAFSLIDNQDEQMFKFDPMAETLVITKDIRKQVKDVFDNFQIPFDPIAEKRKVYYTAILSGDRVFTVYRSPSQQGFTLKFKTGDYDEVNKIWTGVVASLRDPQRYYNKSLTEIMLIIANNSRGGVIYEEDAIDNIQRFEQQWAQMNAAVRVNAGALSGGKIQPKAQPHMQTGYEQVLATSQEAMGKVTGIDESFFGAIAGGNETAMLQRQRIKQATTVLACYVDAITLYTKEQARIMLDFMRLLVQSSEGRLFPIEDDEGNRIFERMSSDFFVDEYDIMISEQPDTPVQREYYTQTLITMAQSMQAIGDPRYLQMYAAAVKYMPIPNKDKTSIIDVLVGQQPVDPAVVQQLEAKVQELEGETMRLANTKLAVDISKTQAEVQRILNELPKIVAETAKTNEEVEKVALENDLMAIQPINNINVNI